jgi:hypothetical protein
LRNVADVAPTVPWAQMPSMSGTKKLFPYVHAGQGLLFHHIAPNQLYCHSIATYQRNTNLKNLVCISEVRDDEAH